MDKTNQLLRAYLIASVVPLLTQIREWISMSEVEAFGFRVLFVILWMYLVVKITQKFSSHTLLHIFAILMIILIFV
ncbi:hypothetical protein [Tuberibacillus sp. Marseille-P3662]|uniref:hypothetical protein n=1 Tax=Tuberibacillus sp. Marseille-P3662 TaxID=1965358 RepID=UPI000A1C9CA6|nr:hypothetical protein [Tuberibacillus sp. Marseille-P3662]